MYQGFWIIHCCRAPTLTMVLQPRFSSQDIKATTAVDDGCDFVLFKDELLRCQNLKQRSAFETLQRPIMFLKVFEKRWWRLDEFDYIWLGARLRTCHWINQPINETKHFSRSWQCTQKQWCRCDALRKKQQITTLRSVVCDWLLTMTKAGPRLTLQSSRALQPCNAIPCSPYLTV